MKIIYDIDGFFSPANMSTDHKLISVDLDQQPFDSLFEQYYLGLRSAMFICEDTIKEENKALEVMRTWRETSVKSAMNYVYRHTKSGQVLSPDFIWIIQTATIDELKNKYPEVVNIQLRVSMKPRLSARVVSKNIVTFPALARTVLNHYNIVLINSIFRDISEDEQISVEPDRRNIARFMFPYLLFCHGDFSVQNLPMICAYSADALNIAMQLTNLQMLFIFAHEYAHILLQHFENTDINSSTKMRIENEADLFALKVVLGHVEKNNSYSKLAAFTAIRWLFKYQLLEESVGILIRGGKLDFSESKFEERRGEFQAELFKNHGLSGSSLLETRGFYILVELQSILYNYGPEFINHIIDKVNESKKTGVIEPWWKEITNK